MNRPGIGSLARSLAFVAVVFVGYAVGQGRHPGKPLPPATPRAWRPTPSELESARGLLRERSDYSREWVARFQAAVLEPARSRLTLGPHVTIDYDPTRNLIVEVAPVASASSLATEGASPVTSQE